MIWLPAYVLDFEARIERAVRELAATLPEGARVLDAGAGEMRHRSAFLAQRYFGVDLAVGDVRWDYSRLDAVADLTLLPLRDGAFDAVINIVTLEHVRQPREVIHEIARVLRPGGLLLLVVPLEWEVHQAPHDYFRYTRHGIEWLLRDAGLAVERLEPAGGIFRLLSRRMLSAVKTHWIAILMAPLALVLPLIDFLDQRRDSTLGYVVWARQPGGTATPARSR